MSRIGIFGGTFNPPHLGHKRLALEAAKAASLERILIIPDRIPPHKVTDGLLDGEKRLELCRLTFFEKFFSVSDVELKREGRSYTFDTLKTLKALFPDDELFLIIGSDMLLSFHTWYRYSDILETVKICYLSRDDEISGEMLLDYARSTLGLSADEIIVCKSEPFEISSSEIRKMIKDGEDVSPYLEKTTAEYIKENSLYNDLH